MDTKEPNKVTETPAPEVPPSAVGWPITHDDAFDRLVEALDQQAMQLAEHDDAFDRLVEALDQQAMQLAELRAANPDPSLVKRLLFVRDKLLKRCPECLGSGQAPVKTPISYGTRVTRPCIFCLATGYVPVGGNIWADCPEYDATDGAHPAWWRGHDHGSSNALVAVRKVLDGYDDGSGTCSEPWQSVRLRLIELRRMAEDDPANDRIIGKAHPAFWRGIDAAVGDAVRAVDRVLKGEDAGPPLETAREDWIPVRHRLLQLMERAKVDGPVFNAGRDEGRADIAVKLRRILDPDDSEHWNLEGVLAEVERIFLLLQEREVEIPALISSGKRDREANEFYDQLCTIIQPDALARISPEACLELVRKEQDRSQKERRNLESRVMNQRSRLRALEAEVERLQAARSASDDRAAKALAAREKEAGRAAELKAELDRLKSADLPSRLKHVLDLAFETLKKIEKSPTQPSQITVGINEDGRNAWLTKYCAQEPIKIPVKQEPVPVQAAKPEPVDKDVSRCDGCGNPLAGYHKMFCPELGKKEKNRS